MASLDGDENFSFPAIVELRKLGHDVLTAQDAGQAGKGIDDLSVLTFAVRLKRAVLTFNRDHFRRLHQKTKSHHGVITCTRDDDVAALALRIHQAISFHSTLQNQLIRITKPASP